MKSKFQAEITKIEKAGGGSVITFEAEGKVDKAGPTAQEATMKGTVFLKNLVGKTIPLGAILTITLTDEEPDTRLV